MEIYKVDCEEPSPAVRVIKGHDHDPLWVAGTLFCIYSKYIETIEEADQVSFEKKVLAYFNAMLQEGYGYIFTKDVSEDDLLGE